MDNQKSGFLSNKSFEILDLFIDYLLKKVSETRFLQFQSENENPYITQAKLALINFQKIMLTSTIWQDIYDKKKKQTEYFQRIEQSKKIQNQRRIEKISHSPLENSDILINLALSNRRNMIEGKENLKQDSTKGSIASLRKKIASNIKIKSNQEKNLYLEDIPRIQRSSVNNLHDAREEQSFYIYHLIGGYLIQILYPSQIANLKNTIQNCEHASYFKLEPHRKLVFTFFQNLIIKIESLFLTTRSHLNITIDQHLMSIGKKLIQYLEKQSLMQSFKWSLKNQCKSSIRNPKCKFKMFRTLQFLFDQIENYRNNK